MPEIPAQQFEAYCNGCGKLSIITKIHITHSAGGVVLDHTQYEEGGHAPYQTPPRSEARIYCSECHVGGG